jgi:hypothetical protein
MGSSDNGSIMPDVYATITEADPATLERLVGAMEIRAAQPRQRAMLESYLSEISFPGHIAFASLVARKPA